MDYKTWPDAIFVNSHQKYKDKLWLFPCQPLYTWCTVYSGHGIPELKEIYEITKGTEKVYNPLIPTYEIIAKDLENEIDSLDGKYWNITTE